MMNTFLMWALQRGDLEAADRMLRALETPEERRQLVNAGNDQAWL